MKKFLLSLLSFIFVLNLSAQENLLVNGGFETGDRTGWNTFNNGIQNTDVYEGLYAGFIKADLQGSFLVADFTVIPGKTYNISFAAKWPDGPGTTAGISMDIQDQDRVLIGGTAKITSTEWTVETAEVTIPDGMTSVRVSIYKMVSPICYVDDVIITEAAGSVPDPDLIMSDDGSIMEDFEDGEVLTLSMTNDVFSDPINPANWTVSNLPEGVSAGSITRISDTEVNITLSGRTTGDYDSDITNMSVVIGADEFVNYSFPFTVNSGVTFTANIEGGQEVVWEEDFNDFPLNTVLDSAYLAALDFYTQGEPDSIKSMDGYLNMFTSSASGNNNWFQKYIELIPGMSYIYTVDLQCDNGSVTRGVVWQATDEQIQGTAVSSTTWATSTAQFKVAADKDTVILGVYKWGAGRIIGIDNMKLVLVTEPTLQVSTDGEIIEGSEDGEVLTFKALYDTFVASPVLANWTASALPEGVTLGSLSRIDDTTIEITLSGNASVDYDQDIASEIMASRDEFVTSTKNLTSLPITFTAIDETPKLTLGYDGEILEGAEDGEVISVLLSNDTFVATLTSANWMLSNLPAGVTLGSVTRVDDLNVQITLSGNATEDYDSDITDVTVTVAAEELTIWDTEISANTGVVLTAILEPVSIAMNDDGEITEGAEDGEVISVTLTNDVFVEALTSSNWTLSNLPAGVTLGTLTRVDDQNATIALSGNATEDYDSDITDVTLVIASAEVSGWTSDLTANSGVTLIAVAEPASISMSDDGEIIEGAEDGEVITVSLDQATFEATLTTGNWTLTNMPAGVSIGSVTRVDDLTAEITLSGNTTEDYDTDITGVELTVAAAEVVSWDSDLTVNTGVTFTAVIESGIDNASLKNVNVYPNPVAYRLNISNAGPIRSIAVMDILGKKIREISNVNENHAVLDVSNWESGIYIVSIQDYNGLISAVKVVKD